MGRKIYRPRAEEGTFEIDLAPMLSMMVTLIPILLLSVIFVRVTVIETSVPQVVAEAIQQDRDKKDRDVSISLIVKDNKSMTIEVVNNGKVSRNTVGAKAGDLSLDELEDTLVNLKRQFPETYSINLKPGEALSYEEIVKVMDKTRSTNKTKFKFRDPKTNENVEHNQMFPNLVFANVVEG